MKVLLINPPRFHELIGKNPAIIEEHRGYNPPLGILYLANYLEKNSNHQVEILDTQPDEIDYTKLKEVLSEKEFDVAGVTTMTFTLIDVVKTVKVIKEVKPNCKVVLGGSHVHLYPEETINLEGVDLLCLGEGEITFLKILDNINNYDKLSEIQGVVFKKDGKIINTGISPIVEDLDLLGFPARHLIDITKYTSLLGKDDTITTMITSRGCPFKCTFCDRPSSPILSKFRWHSAKHVAEEMESCIKMGIKEAFIYDDTFTVRKDRILQLCEEIQKRKIKFRWDVRAHVNTVDYELLKAMKKAGCERIHYGIESGNDRMLKEIKKNTTVERVKEVIRWTKKAGIEVLAYFIIGQQTETKKDIEDSIELAKRLDPNYVHFTIFCPYPGSFIYKEGLKKGIIKKDVWKEFAQNPKEDFELPFWEENFSREELQEMLVQCYKTFYVRPEYIIKNLAKIRSYGELKRKVKAGLSVIGMKARKEHQ